MTTPQDVFFAKAAQAGWPKDVIYELIDEITEIKYPSTPHSPEVSIVTLKDWLDSDSE